jgi:hypothetical protein
MAQPGTSRLNATLVLSHIESQAQRFKDLWSKICGQVKDLRSKDLWSENLWSRSFMGVSGSFMGVSWGVSWTDGSGTLQVTFELPFLFVTVWS